MPIIAVDPGMGGAVCIKADDISVHDMPTKKIVKSGKKKDDIDIMALVELVRPYAGTNNIFVIEDVHAMPGNGSVSMFGFGRSKGILEGVATALGFDVRYVAPQTWKKTYEELAPPPRVKKPKGSAPKTKKEKAEAAKQKRLVKALAKETARKLAGTMYPQLADRFKTVNSDGRAEAVLIAKYAEKHYTENKK